jgi:RNA polymerase sigma-70 factor (ECF subfamily)
MDEHDWLAQRFEAHRTHLRAVAYRMLGSISEADDAVQEAWLRLGRSDTSGVENLGGWLTTVVSRVCLDMLRSRKSRRGAPLGEPQWACACPTRSWAAGTGSTPSTRRCWPTGSGLALLVVLETLAPAERLAFVLHDMFAVPFEEIAPHRGALPDRGEAAREPRTPPGAGSGHFCRRRSCLPAGGRRRLLAASRGGDFGALLAVLDPDVVLRIDGGAARAGLSRGVRGVRAVAEQTLTFSRLSPFVRPALVNGAAGVVVAPRGRPFAVMGFTVRRGRIVEIDVLADPARLRRLDLAVLDD